VKKDYKEFSCKKKKGGLRMDYSRLSLLEKRNDCNELEPTAVASFSFDIHAGVLPLMDLEFPDLG
jgi:hypothetical protein